MKTSPRLAIRPGRRAADAGATQMDFRNFPPFPRTRADRSRALASYPPADLFMSGYAVCMAALARFFAG